MANGHDKALKENENQKEVKFYEKFWDGKHSCHGIEVKKKRRILYFFLSTFVRRAALTTPFYSKYEFVRTKACRK
jgi:hypothetical protein